MSAKPGAPLATPLDWDQGGDNQISARSYTIGNIFKRLGQKEDPWKDFYFQAGSLDDTGQKIGAG